MANERVSQLLELYASDIHSEDLFLVTDMSQRESKKVELGQLLLFIENSGSFRAYNAARADTASYIFGSNVDGAVNTALISSQSVSSSNSLSSRTSVSSSFAITASWAQFAVSSSFSTMISDTSSYLKYTGIPNGTASYAIKSNLSDTATTALNLFYNGQPNGTSSWAVNSSNALLSNTASFVATASTAITSSYSINSGHSSISDAATSSSYAQTASCLVGGNGPTFINPVVIASTTAAIPFTTFDCSPYVPIGARCVILDGWSTNSTTNVVGFIKIRAGTSAPQYVLTSYWAAGSEDGTSSGAQGTFPITSVGAVRNFQYSFTVAADGGTTLRLVGYY